jgi:hypothetical protein
VVFPDAEPPYRVVAAAVSHAFAVCGVEFGPPDADADPAYLPGNVGVPKDWVRVEFSYARYERESDDWVWVSGRLLHSKTVRGLELRAGSQLSLTCQHAQFVPGMWSGEFARDTEVGGLLLRGHVPATVAFLPLGPRVMGGTLARPGIVHDLSLPAGARITVIDPRITGSESWTAECPGAKLSTFWRGAWGLKDCGTLIPPVAPTRPAPSSRTPASAPSPRTPASHVRSSPVLPGSVALSALAAVAAAAVLGRRRRAATTR